MNPLRKPKFFFRGVVLLNTYKRPVLLNTYKRPVLLNTYKRPTHLKKNLDF